MIFISRSPINGLGVFAKTVIPRNQLIGLSHWWNGFVWQSTLLGKYHNHSNLPNAVNIKVGNHRYLCASRDIHQNEEITVNYILQPDLEQPLPNWR